MEPRLGSASVSRLRDTGDHPPVYGVTPGPGAPPVGIGRLDGGLLPAGPPARGEPHSHAFVALAFFERAGGTVRLGRDSWSVEAGDLLLVPPGEVVAHRPDAPTGARDDGQGAGSDGWAVFFLPEALGAPMSGVRLAWQADPLLFPFAGGSGGSAGRLQVPEPDRAGWSARMTAMHHEVTGGGDDAHGSAVRAHLTLLLVEVARLARTVGSADRLPADPLLNEVFGVIEERYADGISLADVADELGLTPGHLTTVVRERTGRTVLEWITERRMAEARRLLVQTGRSIGDVGRRVGYHDAAYFSRTFRRVHGIVPSTWRAAMPDS